MSSIIYMKCGKSDHYHYANNKNNEEQSYKSKQTLSLSKYPINIISFVFLSQLFHVSMLL